MDSLPASTEQTSSQTITYTTLRVYAVLEVRIQVSVLWP